MVGHDDLKSYFDNARRWEQDLLLSAHRSRRTAWVVAAGACALAVASVGAVAALAPLKTVEPFVIRVDNATGIVDTVSALNSTPARYDEAVTKYILRRYVRAREGYSYPEAETNFRTISPLDCMSPPQNEATHPRCCEGCLDGPGRASNKEGESWGIIAKLSWASIHRSCAMRWRLPKRAAGASCAIWAR